MASQHTVDVTQDDIDQALEKSSSRCVVAVAIARTFPKARHISVDVHAIKFTDGDRRFTYLTPYPVAEYIVAFDAGDELHPFRFRLRNDQRMITKRNQRTDAGREVERAKQTEKRRAKAVEKVDANPAATDAERTVAREKLAIAEANRRMVQAKVQAAKTPQYQLEDVSEVPPTNVKPRPQRQSTVFRRDQRHYGHRVMRVNNDTGPGDFRGPLDIDQD